MNILHITNSYGGTNVYTNLYTSIDRLSDITQLVYVALNSRNHNRIGNKLIDFKNTTSEIYYSTILKYYHSYFYGAKIRSIVKDIEKRYDLSKITLIHASTLCSDGAVAYELNKKYNIPYVVALRNTDVHGYYDKFIWRRGYFTKILLNASQIIFISPKYKENFIKTRVKNSLVKNIEDKVMVIPNGINKEFLDNILLKEKNIGNQINVIFVAAFYQGKGLVETIKAIDNLRGKHYNIQFNAIGKGLPNRPQDSAYIEKVERMSEGKNWIRLQPFKTPTEIIKEMRASDVFVMVSSPETFGLVYVEALTQGLPILYTKNEGFDGFYPDGKVGYAAEAGNVDDIADKLERIINEYTELSSNITKLDLKKDFDWQSIGQKYINIYNSISR